VKLKKQKFRFGCTPLEAKGGRWAGAWSTHLLLTKDTFVLEIPKDISEFAACTCHTLALAYSACKRIIERDDPATIVVQGKPVKFNKTVKLHIIQ
jgi:threonine dehydrogenase-like Zn-dependent dehydrogenase